jgi:hypothetical protein
MIPFYISIALLYDVPMHLLKVTLSKTTTGLTNA